MENVRTQRVAELIRDELASLLQKDVKDPRIGFITLTGVEVSPDLRVARVYYTVLGEEQNREDTARGLRSAYPFLRREVGRRLRLKVVPELRFEYDESVERGFRIRELLEELHHEPEDPDR